MRLVEQVADQARQIAEAFANVSLEFFELAGACRRAGEPPSKPLNKASKPPCACGHDRWGHHDNAARNCAHCPCHMFRPGETAETAELKRLRAENARLRAENARLHAARADADGFVWAVHRNAVCELDKDKLGQLLARRVYLMSPSGLAHQVTFTDLAGDALDWVANELRKAEKPGEPWKPRPDA